MNKYKYPCPCCGYIVFEKPGDDAICTICSWNNNYEYINPTVGGGEPNRYSLYQCQRNYINFGASIEEFANKVRKPTKDDIKDPEWEIYNEKKHGEKVKKNKALHWENWPKDGSELYYWKK